MKNIVIIFTIICCLLAGFNVLRPTSVSAVSYSVPSPTNLQASVWGIANGNAAVTVEWGNSTAGLNYLVTKINPEGAIMQFVLQSAITDPNCMMQGGFFQDPLVEKGKTYTYKVKAFDGGLNYSAEASIAVTINIGDSVGCRGRYPLSLNSEAKNFSVALNWSNPDKKNFDIYVDGKLKKTTDQDDTTIWPVFGKDHEVKIVESEVKSKPLVTKASACETEIQNQTLTVSKNYSGFIGKVVMVFDKLVY